MGSTVEKKIKDTNSDYYLMSIAISSIGACLLGRAFLESTGLLTNGWITRDLPFWIAFMLLMFIYQNVTAKRMISEE